MRPPARIDLELLEALDALHAELNVTRAAARLGLSQPAMSARLTRLRERFGDRLFVPSPSGRGVLPTPRALALAPAAADLLDRLAALAEPAGFDPATSERTFTLAMPENPAVMLGPDLLPRLRAAASHVRLLVVLPDKERMPALLERGEVDLFVGVRSAGDKAWLSRALFEDSFATARRKGHPGATTALDLDAFCAASHLLVSSEGDPFSGLLDQALAVLGRRRVVAVSLQSYAVAPTMVATSDLLTTLPRRFLHRFAHVLDLLEPPLALPRMGVTAYWHPTLHDDPGHRWLRAQVFAAAGAVRGGERQP